MENIQEVVTELENQPETNLLPEEVEEKFSQLMVRRVEGGEGGRRRGKRGGEGRGKRGRRREKGEKREGKEGEEGEEEDGTERYDHITAVATHRYVQIHCRCISSLLAPPTSTPSHLTLPPNSHSPQDFIIDLETFESQKAELIGQLESTLHPLTQFPQESPTQLRRTTEKLKQGYETVTEKVCHPSHPHHPHILPFSQSPTLPSSNCHILPFSYTLTPSHLPTLTGKQQKVLLERWRDQWNKFSRQLSHFEDWVGRAEELVTMETYGHSLTEMEAHVTAVKVCV